MGFYLPLQVYGVQSKILSTPVRVDALQKKLKAWVESEARRLGCLRDEAISKDKVRSESDGWLSTQRYT